MYPLRKRRQRAAGFMLHELASRYGAGFLQRRAERSTICSAIRQQFGALSDKSFGTDNVRCCWPAGPATRIGRTGRERAEVERSGAAGARDWRVRGCASAR